MYKIHPQIATVSLNLGMLWSNSRDHAHQIKALEYKFNCLYNLEECYKDIDHLNKVMCFDEIAKSCETLSGLKRTKIQEKSIENCHKKIEISH
jgi:hypothetical protein